MHNDPSRATGEATLIVQPDPLLQLILEYSRARDLVNANEAASDEQTALDMVLVNRICRQIETATPPCTTEAGAAAGLRFIAAERQEAIEDFHAPVLASVLRLMLLH